MTSRMPLLNRTAVGDRASVAYCVIRNATTKTTQNNESKHSTQRYRQLSSMNIFIIEPLKTNEFMKKLRHFKPIAEILATRMI